MGEVNLVSIVQRTFELAFQVLSPGAGFAGHVADGLAAIRLPVLEFSLVVRDIAVSCRFRITPTATAAHLAALRFGESCFHVTPFWSASSWRQSAGAKKLVLL